MDDPIMKGTKRMQGDEAEGEFKLEKELQSFALNYHKLMKDRASQKKPETLRSLLAYYYQQLLSGKHKEVAKKRFPHVAYGQDPKSVTFQKSFP